MTLPAQTSARVLLDEAAIARTLTRIAHEIIEGNPDLERVALVGIHTRGVPLAQRLRRLIHEFSRTSRGRGERPAGLDELTPREVEVFNLLARGMSNAEIGKELYLSEATVKTHLTRILSKLGVRDRVQAVVLAYESGLVEPGDS